MTMQICLMCGKPADVGLRINTALLCRECEQELVTTDVTDPRYALYVARLKQAWPASHYA